MMHRAKMFILIVLFVLNQVHLNESPPPPPPVVECGTLDIREFTDLPLLNDCTVVIGSLDIILWHESATEKYSSQEINMVSFPNLREITGFLFLHSIQHLKSLGTLFPNLTLIRGERLFSHYALVIYDMSDLEEISLRNLLRIDRGSVRIDGINPHLCLPQIDWSLIIKNGHAYIGTNAAKSCDPNFGSLCLGCLLPKLCWNHRYCQRTDESYYIKGKRWCHKTCLGQCVNETSQGCFTCAGISEDQRCVDECSPATLLNSETKRCITPQKCFEIDRKMYNDHCVAACPPGFSTDTEVTGAHKDAAVGIVCKKCQKKCPRVCYINEPIRYLSHLEALGPGCTIINGSLEINLLSDVMDVMKEMDIYLGDIQEIWGNLKIYRSVALTSLSFLNNLYYIQGSESNINNIFSIRIFENYNLQSLIDFKKRKKGLILDNNSMQFHNNRVLCVQDINNLRNNTTYNGEGAKAKDMFENNGFRKFCFNDNIETKFEVLSTSEVKVMWNEMETATVNMNASFDIYYSISQKKEIEPKLFLERDACAAQSWKIIYVKRPDLFVEIGYLSHILTNLEQYQIYAFFIQTYMHDSVAASPTQFNTKNGQSKVQFFQTFMDIPSRVYNLSSVATTDTSLTFNWKVHENEFDAIEYFYIDIIVQPDFVKSLDKRNYCENPIRQAEYDEAACVPTVDGDKDDKEDHDIPYSPFCCDFCPGEHKRPFLQLPELTRSKRDVNDFESILEEEVKKGPPREENPRPKRSIEEYVNYVGRRNFTGKVTNYTIEGLKTFTQYAFQFYACTYLKCSDYELHTKRTLKNYDYDKLSMVPKSHLVYGDQIVLHFDEPTKVNGAVIYYIIEYRSDQINLTVHSTLETVCITRRQHEVSKHNYYLTGLSPGLYYIRAKAASIAGQGPFTEWHQYKLIKAYQGTVASWITLSVVLFMIFASIVTCLVYNRHKIFITADSDRVMLLMTEIRSTDSNEISSRSDHDDQEMSDISEEL